MKVEIVKNEKTHTKEAFIEDLLVGVFEQMTPQSDIYSFMSKCPHEKLTGSHYIAIGEKLQELNASKSPVYRLTVFPALEASKQTITLYFNSQQKMNESASNMANMLLFLQDTIKVMADYSNVFLRERFLDGEWQDLEEELS